MIRPLVRRRRDRARAVALIAGLIAWNNTVLPAMGLSPRGRAAANAGAALGLTALVGARGANRSDLGLTRSDVPAGVRWGAAAGAVPLLGFVVMLAVPTLRVRLGDEARGGGREDFLEWVALHIPLGTVLGEELLFRSVLSVELDRAWGPLPGRAVHAATFGLWHIQPARAAGDSVPGTVMVTGLSALIFEWLRRRSGSIVAPALLHLAINAGAATAVRLASRRR